jgi:tetratricopeptide (TPR) repeat protein
VTCAIGRWRERYPHGIELARLALALLCVMLAPRSAAHAGEERAQRFESANAAFAAGDFTAAKAGFQAILEADGPSAAVLYNLGNACFRAGLVGEAVLSYERALLIAPRDQDMRANLRQVRNAAGLAEPAPGPWTRLVRLLTGDGWAWLASVALYVCCAALLALRLLRANGSAQQLRSALRFSAAAAAATVVIGAAACAARLAERDRAVVLAADPTLRVAPYASATASSELAPGEVVRIERIHQGFALVRTSGGKSGWMNDAGVARIAPPQP